MKAVEEIITELADREEIRDLPVRYCDCVWRGDVNGLVELFAVDGSFIVKTPNGETVYKGHEALLKSYAESLRDLQPRPYIHNHVVELGFNGRATGRCYLDLRSEKYQMQWVGSGYYNDEYVKVGDHWKFASRYFTAMHFDPATAARTAPAAKPAARVKQAGKPKPPKATTTARKKATRAKRKARR
ncbi:MAG TPA: nuclear transport factor 2 family protein [Candidatus Binataceae bacterium]|nr:nuclear transport factor 2 family protein [Candidatus Binataceae bacterium]